MTPIRILLVDLPPLVRDIIAEALAGESDMMIVGSAATRADGIPLARQHAPHVVIVRAENDVAAEYARELQNTSSAITVIALSAKGDHATVFSARGAPIAVADVSATTLIMAIRDYTDVNDSTKFPPG